MVILKKPKLTTADRAQGFLTRGVCDAPSISIRGGRPKKKRISLQQATEEIDKRQTRKCGICNQFGHNRRTCTTKGGVLNV